MLIALDMSAWCCSAVVYYIKLQHPFVCVSICLSVCLFVCLYPPFSPRPSDRDHIWQAYVNRSGNGSNLNKFAPPPPPTPRVTQGGRQDWREACMDGGRNGWMEGGARDSVVRGCDWQSTGRRFESHSEAAWKLLQFPLYPTLPMSFVRDTIKTMDSSIWCI